MPCVVVDERALDDPLRRDVVVVSQVLERLLERLSQPGRVGSLGGSDGVALGIERGSVFGSEGGAGLLHGFHDLRFVQEELDPLFVVIVHSPASSVVPSVRAARAVTTIALSASRRMSSASLSRSPLATTERRKPIAPNASPS